VQLNKKFLNIILISLVVPVFSSKAQTAGNNSFDFLSFPNSARIAALGGNIGVIRDNDLSLAVANPSLITKDMHNMLALSYVNNYTDINLGYAALARNFEKFGTFTGSLQFIEYGQAKYSDDAGAIGGKFNMADYALNVGWGRNLDSVFSIGANFKLLYSDLEAYNSLGVAVDVAGSYFPDKNTCFSLLFRNIGSPIYGYTSQGVEPLPFEIQAGMSRRLAHLPFRFSILLQHLEKWNLLYSSTESEIDPFTGQKISRSNLDKFADNAMRHVILGGEFIPARFLSIRLGYNYMRRSELRLDSRPGIVGFSWGIGLHVSRFNIDYSRANYHIVGARNYVTLSTNLDNWVKK
jgi:hypothetical protein